MTRHGRAVRADILVLALVSLVIGGGLASFRAVAASGTCESDQFVVAIDIGHTPKRSGATSARGRSEYTFNLGMATTLQQTLRERGFPRAFLINEEGAEIGLRARTAVAAERGADVFLSVHHDSVQPHYLEAWTADGTPQRYSDAFRGFSLFVSAKGAQPTASRTLAEAIGSELVASGLRPSLHHAEPIPGENRELLDERRGIYRFDDLIVLKTATMPAVLVEAGIIVNRDEEAALATDAYRTMMADAITDALTAVCAAAR